MLSYSNILSQTHLLSQILIQFNNHSPSFFINIYPKCFYYPIAILHPKHTQYSKNIYYPIIIYHPFSYKYPINFYYPKTILQHKYTYYSIIIYHPFSNKQPKSLCYHQITLHLMHTFILSNINFPSYSPKASSKHILSQVPFLSNNNLSYFSLRYPKSLYYPIAIFHPKRTYHHKYGYYSIIIHHLFSYKDPKSLYYYMQPYYIINSLTIPIMHTVQ